MTARAHARSVVARVVTALLNQTANRQSGENVSHAVEWATARLALAGDALSHRGPLCSPNSTSPRGFLLATLLPMSNQQNSLHAGLAAGITSALPLGLVLGLFVFHNLVLGLSAALTIGVLAGLLAAWRLGPR